jgi:hypothetical protein
MPLFAYNLTASPVTMAAGNPAPILPSSSAPPARSKPYDVTSELWPNLTIDPARGKTGGLTGPNYVSIQAQVTAGSIALAWTSDPEYVTTGLTVAGPAPAPHSHTNSLTTATNNVATATNNAETAVNQNTPGPQMMDLGAPDAEDDDVVHALFAGNNASSDFPGPFTNPDVPRNIKVTFEAGWDGGNVTVTGLDQFLTPVSEVVVASAGNTVAGTKIFATVTAATKGAVGSSSDGASIGVGKKIGISVDVEQAFGLLAVDGVSEAAVFDDTYSAVTPTSAPTGAKVFVALIITSHTHVQNSHNHTQASHNHTQSSHTHTIS